MAKIVTSARGEKVDFDLLRIKNSMAAVPPTENVKKRERFINKKRRRGLGQMVDELVQAKSSEAVGVQTQRHNADNDRPVISENLEPNEAVDVQEEDAPAEKIKRKVK